MQKIDKRKNYYLTIDTETANTLDKPYVYDIGMAIHDKKGKIYESYSFLIFDVYHGERTKMQSAYYAEKLPLYEQGLATKKHTMVTFMQAWRMISYLNKKWKPKAAVAYNMRFDLNALNNTLRYVTEGQMKYFFPKNLDLWCTWTMAKQTICKQKSYIAFAQENELYTGNGRISTSAENVYRYMIDDPLYIEEHTGLADVKIEVDIFARIMRQNRKIRKRHWGS